MGRLDSHLKPQLSLSVWDKFKKYRLSALFVIFTTSVIYYDYSLTQKAKQNKLNSK